MIEIVFQNDVTTEINNNVKMGGTSETNERKATRAS
jgi:hypothetical protein